VHRSILIMHEVLTTGHQSSQDAPKKPPAGKTIENDEGEFEFFVLQAMFVLAQINPSCEMK
jgi:hypothetical protein